MEAVAALEAGRTLDERIAVEVMGWKWRPADPSEEWVVLHEDWWKSPKSFGKPPADLHKKVPPYSTDIAAAFEVFDKLVNDSPDTVRGGVEVIAPGSGDTPVWECWLEPFWNGGGWRGEGDTPMEAICRCALMASAALRGVVSEESWIPIAHNLRRPVTIHACRP